MNETLNVSKGQRIDVTKSNPTMKRVGIGLGWETTENNFDADAFMMALTKEGKLYQGNKGVLYFGSSKMTAAAFATEFPGVRMAENPPTEILGGALIHSGDNRTGAGAGDDETMIAKLGELPEEVERLIIGVDLYQAKDRHQNFGMCSEAYVRVFDFDTNEEILKDDLVEDYSTSGLINVAEFYRHNGEWKFKAVNEGVAMNGIDKFANNY